MTNNYNLLDRVSIKLSNLMDREGVHVKSRSFIHTATSLFSRTTIIGAAIIALWGFAPTVETAWFPVVHSFRADNFKLESDGNWTFQVHGMKPWYRGNCSYVKDQTLNAVIITPDHTAYEGKISYIDDDTPNSTRPALPFEQSFGTWKLETRPTPVVGSQIFSRVLHNCNLPWITVSNIGPFTVGKDSPRPVSPSS